jgi:RIO-like serine/threonine protein kinase
MGRTLTRLEWELEGDTDHSVVVTVITDGYENSSREYDRSAIRALVEHLQDKGWSFAYVGTDHDVHGVSVSLSIKNVIEFRKTGEETVASFRKERRAREKWAEDLHSFSLDCPDASPDEKVRFRKEKAAHYYDEDPGASEGRGK